MNEHILSYAQTFVSTLVLEIGTALIALPEGTLFNPEFWKAGAIIAFLHGAVRATLKVMWKGLPPKLGGVRK